MSRAHKIPANGVQQETHCSRRKSVTQQGSIIRILKSKDVRLGLIVLFLGIFIRALYLYQSRDNPTFSVPVVDSMTYDQLARKLVEEKAMTVRFFWQQFFYPYFLSVVYFFSNSSIVCVKLVQIFLGGITCVLTYRLGKRLFGRPAGFISACIMVFYGPLIFFECELLDAGWATFWAVMLIWFFLMAAEKDSGVRYIVLGLCGALSIITRPNFIPFYTAGCIWLVVVWIKRQVSADKVAFRVLGISTSFLVAVMPVAVWNYRVTSNFSFLPATGGLNFYLGNNPDFDATSIRPGAQWQRMVDQPVRLGFNSPDQQQHFFYTKTMDYIRMQPTGFLKGILRKTTEFISSREMPGNIDIYLFTRWSRLLSLLVWKIDGFGFPFGVLLPLALLGIFFYRLVIPAPVILFCVFYPFSIILTHIEARYRMPVVAPMSILAGAAVVKISEMIRLRRWFKVVMAIIFSVAAASLSSFAGPFYSERHVNYEAELYYGLGGSLQSRDRIDDAIQAYSRAISLKGDYADAHHNVGLLLVRQNRIEEGLAHFNTALKLDPEDAALHRDLGLAFFMQGKAEEAFAHYHKAIQINPNDAAAHEYLGLACQSQGKVDEAISYFNQALKIDPLRAETHYNLGIALQLKGRLDKAVEQYTEALRIKPGLINVRSNLGVILARQGKFDEAIRNFTEVLKSKPDSAEVHYNLGLVLVSQGKVEQAVSHYQQALKIKPDYAACLNKVVQILVSHPDARVRDANKAIALAERASELTEGKNTSILDVLAAAYAAGGQFDRAVATVQRAIDLGTAAGDYELVKYLRKQLEAYNKEKPYQ